MKFNKILFYVILLLSTISLVSGLLWLFKVNWFVKFFYY